MMRKVCIVSLALLTVLATVGFAAAGLNKEQELGKLLYFDRYLSANHNQSCASCHDQAAGFADPLNLRLPDQFPTSAGSDTTLFGGRNAPPAGYAMFSPPFGFDPVEGLYVGGQFWDGRAATLKDQAMGPFLNPVEMAMPSKTAVIAALKDPANRNAPDYQALFNKVYKIDLAAIDTTLPEPVIGPDPDVFNAYDKLAQAIGEFEKSDLFAPFSSKFDAVMAGAATFTPVEANGWALFNGAAQCHLCHPAPLFTDFTYDNLGIPVNPQFAGNPIDYGLGAIVGADENGKFKVSSLRNLDLTPPYGHNGFFVTIKEIVHFYNTRDTDPIWADPEVTENVNVDELGDLGLSDVEEDALVAFLKTLTDRPGGKSYVPKIP
jgi:cytochrome c peroxidase